MPSGLRVVGIGGAPRESFDIEAKKRMVRERTDDFIFDEGGEGGGGEMRGAHPGAAHTRRIRQRQYVLGRSPCQRHCRSRTKRGRRVKKRENEEREKIRLGINADLTVDDWSPAIVRR